MGSIVEGAGNDSLRWGDFNEEAQFPPRYAATNISPALIQSVTASSSYISMLLSTLLSLSPVPSLPPLHSLLPSLQGWSCTVSFHPPLLVLSFVSFSLGISRLLFLSPPPCHAENSLLWPLAKHILTIHCMMSPEEVRMTERRTGVIITHTSIVENIL